MGTNVYIGIFNKANSSLQKDYRELFKYTI